MLFIEKIVSYSSVVELRTSCMYLHKIHTNNILYSDALIAVGWGLFGITFLLLIVMTSIVIYLCRKYRPFREIKKG